MLVYKVTLKARGIIARKPSYRGNRTHFAHAVSIAWGVMEMYISFQQCYGVLTQQMPENT